MRRFARTRIRRRATRGAIAAGRVAISGLSRVPDAGSPPNAARRSIRRFVSGPRENAIVSGGRRDGSSGPPQPTMLFSAVVAPRIVPARDVRTGKRTSPTRASATTRSAASGSSWRGRERRKAPGPGERRACVSGLPRSAGARPAVSARPWPSGGFDRRPRSRTRRRPGPSNSSRTRSARPVAAAIETSAGCIGPGSGWTGEPRGAPAGSAGARARLAGFRERSLGGATAARPGRPVNRRATRRGRPGWGPAGGSGRGRSWPRIGPPPVSAGAPPRAAAGRAEPRARRGRSGLLPGRPRGSESGYRSASGRAARERPRRRSRSRGGRPWAGRRPSGRSAGGRPEPGPRPARCRAGATRTAPPSPGWDRRAGGRSGRSAGRSAGARAGRWRAPPG